MADFDYDKFRRETETRLKALDNPPLCAAFAVRMALLALPFLVEKAEEKGFLWFWGDNSEQHLLATCKALQVTYLNINKVISPYTAQAAAYAAADAAADADAATAAYAAAKAAYAAAKAAADAAAYAADAATYAIETHHFTKVIQKELKQLDKNTNIDSYLTRNIPLSSIAQEFFSHLRDMPSEFDYWADWLQERYAGKPLNLALLEKSVYLPEEVQAQSPAAINRYLKQLRDGANEKVKRVRAIFIGDGEAGKTSLIRALNNQEVSEGSTDMTPGIETSEWPVADTDLIAHFWDFGGQVIAHATHQFFLRARCVYIIVLNARSVGSNPNQQAEYWLEYVQAFGENAPVLLVGNKCDLTPINIDIHRLCENYPNVIPTFFPLSATQYQNNYAHEFSIFKRALNQQLCKVGENLPYFSKKHFAVVETLREKSCTSPFLSKRTFTGLCNSHKIGLEQREDLIDLLDKLGEIIHFPKLEWLNDFILNPRWLTYGVYQLLYSKRLKNQQGRLSRNDIAEILKDHKTKDNLGNILRYPPERNLLLVKAMQQFKLCYPAVSDATDNEWIMPDLLPSDQPALLNFDTRAALHFEFDFKSFLPRHVLSMFIVEHYHDIYKNQVWQHGVHLYSDDWNTAALVRANYQDRVLTLHVKGRHADRYFSILYNSILTILNRMPKLEYAKLLYLPETAKIDMDHNLTNEKPHANFEDLLALQADGQTIYTCRYGKYDLIKALKLLPKPETTISHPLPTESNDPWQSGSFFLTATIAITLTLSVAAYFLHALLPIIIIGTVAMVSIIGAFQLRNDQQLTEASFVKLLLEFYKRLFNFRKK